MSPYQRFIETLSDEQLNQLARGELGFGCGDSGYCLVENGASPLQNFATDIKGVRAVLCDRETAVKDALFRAQPLCRVEFDYQAAELLEEYGVARFCHHQGNPGGWALMIDETQLVAVDPDDVRSRYGYFCHSDKKLSGDDAAEKVWAWLGSGEAYEDYRSKTTCRYNC